MYEKTNSYANLQTIIFDNAVDVLNLVATCNYTATLNGKYLLDRGSVTMYLKASVYDENNTLLMEKQTSKYAAGTRSDTAEYQSGGLSVSMSNVNLKKAKKVLIQTSYSTSGSNNYSSAKYSNYNSTIKMNVYEFKDDIIKAIINNSLFKKVTIQSNG